MKTARSRWTSSQEDNAEPSQGNLEGVEIGWAASARMKGQSAPVSDYGTRAEMTRVNGYKSLITRQELRRRRALARW